MLVSEILTVIRLAFDISISPAPLDASLSATAILMRVMPMIEKRIADSPSASLDFAVSADVMRQLLTSSNHLSIEVRMLLLSCSYL